MLRRKSARLRTRHPAVLRVDEELELRQVREKDAPAVFALTDANRAYLRRWLPWVDGTRTVEDTRGFIVRAMDQLRRNDGFQTTIRYRGEMVGLIGYLYVNGTDKRTEIGYWLAEPFQGRGIMTRACRTLVDYAFGPLGMNRVEIRVATENAKSRAIPERLGFVSEATLRESVCLNGRFVDLVVYGRLRSDPPRA